VQAASPAVAAMTGDRDVRGVVREARWDAARLIAERGHLTRLRNEATFAGYGLDQDDPLRSDLQVRAEQLTLRLETMGAELAGRVDRLRSLAGLCADIVGDQRRRQRAPRMARRARAAVADADAAMLDSSRWDVSLDPALTLNDRTAAMLAAYRELAGGG
jgi:hypothetical protein